jgi:hypothetical protein
MKRHILILLLAATTCLGSFRTAEAQTAIAIDYVAADNAYATVNGSGFYFNQWKVNKRYQSSAVDTSGNFTCKWAAVRFDSLYDANSSMGYPSATTALRIDTIGLDVNHQKNSGSSDTLTVSVLQRAANVSGFSSQDNGITLTNTVLWDTMIVTNTSLTPGLNLNQIGHLSIPCNLNIPAGIQCIVKVDFTGDTVNHFYMVDYWRTDCVPYSPDSSGASESVFPLNSWRYFNMFIPPSTDLGGVGGLIISGFPSNCNQYYFQNFGISINAGATVPSLSVNIGNDTTICSGNSVQLTAFASGGKVPYAFAWSSVHTTQSVNYFPTVTSMYSVTVVDGLGAIAVDTVTVFVNQSPVMDSFVVNNMSCFGVYDGSICPFVSGGTLPYQYIWSDAQSLACPPNRSPGWYSVTVRDANGCFVEDSATITQPAPINIQLTSATSGIYPDTICISNVSGGVPAYTYSYSGNCRAHLM